MTRETATAPALSQPPASKERATAATQSVREGMSLLDHAIRSHDHLPAEVRKLEPANLRAFHLLSKNAPEQYLQEFRQLRGRLQRVRGLRELNGVRTRSILVTSPRPRQGKSFVALNLALMIAVAPEARILLVDLNVRRPSFNARFKLPPGPGIEEIIAGADWREAAWWMPDTQLHIAPLSETPRDIMDPLHYDQLASRLEELSSSFDWILFDGPSLLESPDAEIAAHLADATLLVASREKTTFEEMDDCVARLAPGKLAGVVYNAPRS